MKFEELYNTSKFRNTKKYTLLDQDEAQIILYLPHSFLDALNAKLSADPSEYANNRKLWTIFHKFFKAGDGESLVSVMKSFSKSKFKSAVDLLVYFLATDYRILTSSLNYLVTLLH